MVDGQMDYRVRFTRDLLRKSLLKLMKTIPIGEISVTELCAVAKINRGTFYRHYATPYELLRRIQEDLYETIRNLVEGAASGNELTTMLENLFSAIEANSDICRILFSENGDKDFLRSIVNIAHDKAIAEWKRQFRKSEHERYRLAYVFVVGGSLSLIQEWIDGGFKESPKEMARFIDSLTSTGINGEFSDKKRY